MTPIRRPSPSPRPSIQDPSLCRPDWTQSQRRRSDILWLDKNENVDPGIHAIAQRVLANMDPAAIFSYPDCAPLYQQLAQSEGIAVQSLLLTAGSDGAIRTVFETYISPGDKVLLPAPTFAMYPLYCKMFGAEARILAYERSASGPHLPVERILTALAREQPKMLCLPNPDSPTGTVFWPDALQCILDAAAAMGTLVLVDEAYYPFYENTVAPQTAVSPHLIVARTFSKAWGLAGLRLGYLIALPEVVGLLHKVRPMYEVNTVGVAIAMGMLAAKDEVMQSVGRLQQGKVAFQQAARALGLSTYESYGNFFHVAFGSHTQAVHAALREIVLYRLDFTEPCLAGYSRFSAAPPGLLKPVMQAIEDVVRPGRKPYG